MVVHPDTRHGLAFAVVASATSPLVLLNGDLEVIGASETFYRAFNIDPETAPGRQIFDIGEEEKTVEIKLKDPQPQYSVHQ